MEKVKKTDVWQVYPKGENDHKMAAELKERYNIGSNSQLFLMLLKKEYSQKK
jgi:hypothetical protein